MNALPDGGQDNAIAREASLWHAKRRESLLALADERAFRTWYEADPAHAHAYDAMTRTFDDVVGLKELAALEPLDEPRRRTSRWAIASAGLAVAAAVIAFVVLPGLLQAPIQAHATQIAQLDILRLSDGSVVTLGAASNIDVRITSTERRVRLVNGEAFFDIAPDPRRPFVVEAGDAIIRDIGTKFNVSRGGSRVRVSVLEGIVDVQQPRAGLLLERPAPVRLVAGERAELRDAMQITASVTPPPLSRAVAPGAWREGRLIYDDVRLGDLVADLNRYYAPGVRIADSSLADVRVAASFRAGEIETFLATLPSAAPVNVERNSAGAVMLTSRRN